MEDKTGGIDFFAGFVIGALVGAAAALLLAPQSGEETRTMIRDKGIELKDQADEMGLEARKQAEGVQTRVKDAVEEGKVAASTKKEELLNKLEGTPESSEA